MNRPYRIGLGFSGGGDSTALLYTLRQCLPDLELHAFIVDHGLRAQSGREASLAADIARSQGAHVQILRWQNPKASQGHARLARHRLLAKACQNAGIDVLCLAHTLDDRIETLRMRADREGDWSTLTGPSQLDISPVWPEGRQLVISRPFLKIRRQVLRNYLTIKMASWIEDPSNLDCAYERIRLRQTPLHRDRENELLEFSDTALKLNAAINEDAFSAFTDHAEVLDWGGVQLNPNIIASLAQPVAQRFIASVMTCVSGSMSRARPNQVNQVIQALITNQGWSGAGVMVTQDGIMGRDRGVCEGRSDGQSGLQDMTLRSGQKKVFDGRWLITAHEECTIGVAGPNPNLGQWAHKIPSKFRSGVLVDRETGLPFSRANLGQNELLIKQRMRSLLLPSTVPSCFDKLHSVCCEHVGLVARD